MIELFGFENLNAYRYSRILVSAVYKLTQTFPDYEKFGLSNQVRRAAVSVPSNIAEGNGRIFTNEQKHFYEIAYGSLMEVYCQISLAFDLGYISETQRDELKELITICARLISGLHKSTKNQTKESK